jgi:Gpi18-like mannosyltransferase
MTRPLLGILGAGLALRLALLGVHGKMHDVTIFAQWARMLMTFGTHGLYDHVVPWSTTAINYPPGYALMLFGVVRAYELVAAGGNTTLLYALLKLPAILADVVSAAVVYAIVLRYASRSQALIAAAIAAFAPWTWPLSAVMGQVDSVCAMFLLIALAFAFDERYAASWIALAAGTLIKPFPILVVPLLLAAQVRSQGLTPRIVAGPALALGLAYAVSLPFAPSAAPFATLAWLAHEYGSGQGLFPLTSFFAANVWTLVSHPVPDARRVLGVSLQLLGWLGFGASTLFVLAIALRRMDAVQSRPDRMRVFVTAWFLVLFALFVLTTRMHERYLAYALAIAPAMWSFGPSERRIVIILAVTFVAGIALAMVRASAGAEAFATIPVRIVSLVNVATFALALYEFNGRRRAVAVTARDFASK